MEEAGYDMELEFLGTGTSIGVPVIGCKCEVCRSSDEHDRRFRSSVIVRTQGKAILIDCGPDFRSQMLKATDVNLDAMLVTHSHYDHVGGVDDLRPYCYVKGRFPIYAQSNVIDDLRNRIPYCFATRLYPGVPTFHTHAIDERPFDCLGITITPLPVWHARLLVMGYRIGRLAYITDAKKIDESTMSLLEGVEVLVINALRMKPHMSHQTLGEALEIITRLQPKHAYLTHLSHDMGLHEQVSRLLPDNVSIAYDGLVVRL